jgi:hypothetical protein
LFQQTPWNTATFGFLTFADAKVETRWLETRVGSKAREKWFAIFLFLWFAGARIKSGDARRLFESLTGNHARGSDADPGVSLLALLLRFEPLLFSLAFLALSSAGTRARLRAFGLTASKRQLLACAFRAARFSVNLPATFPVAEGDSGGFLSIGEETLAPRSVFQAGVFAPWNENHVSRFATLLFAESILPLLFQARVSRHLATSVVCVCCSRVLYGSWFKTGNVAGFDASPDLCLRFGLMGPITAATYAREYRDRFSFLMRFFAPGKKKVA